LPRSTGGTGTADEEVAVVMLVVVLLLLVLEPYDVSLIMYV